MDTLIVEHKDHLLVISINRPEALNILNSAVIADLSAAVSDAAQDENIYVIIITGTGGKAFAAGADVGEMQGMTVLQAKSFSQLGHQVFRMIENCPKPVIAAVNGYALGGGCELAMACDIRIASENARFGQPETGLGIIPGFGGTQRLPRQVGSSKAMEMILTGQVINADEALAIGLVSRVVAPEALLDEAIALAGRIAAKAQVAVRQAKRCIRHDMPGFDNGFALEAEAFSLCFATEDQKDAMTAFLAKQPVTSFKNK